MDFLDAQARHFSFASTPWLRRNTDDRMRSLEREAALLPEDEALQEQLDQECLRAGVDRDTARTELLRARLLRDLDAFEASLRRRPPVQRAARAGRPNRLFPEWQHLGRLSGVMRDFAGVDVSSALDRLFSAQEQFGSLRGWGVPQLMREMGLHGLRGRIESASRQEILRYAAARTLRNPSLLRNAPLKRPTVDHFWTGEQIDVPAERPRHSKWTSNGFVIYRGPSMFDGLPIICIASGFVDPSSNEKTGPMIQTWIMREDLDPQQAVWSGGDSSICGDCIHRGEVRQRLDRPWIGRRCEESVMTPGLMFEEGGVRGKRRRLLPKSEDRSCYVVVSQAPLSKWKQYHRGEFPVVKLEDLPDLFQGAFPVRIGSYGDPTAVPVEVWRGVLERQVCWTGYTSQWRSEENQEYKDFLMASVSDPVEMQEAHRLGWRTFRVGRKNEPLIAGVEIICPATPEGGFRTQCDSCNLCMGRARSGAKSIVTAPHGSGAKYHERRGEDLRSNAWRRRQD